LPAAANEYYVVLLPTPEGYLEEPILTEAAQLLQLKSAELGRILVLRQPLPATRTTAAEEASEITEALRALGIESATVPSHELHLEEPSKKISALEFSDEALTATVVGSNARLAAGWDDLILLVTGRLVLSRIEVEERRRRGRKQTVNSRHLSADESVLDVYLGTSEISWRIRASNFDFSCLGSARSFTAFENFTALMNVLRKRATKAQFDDSYAPARSALEIVWPVEPQTKIGDWRRSGAGKVDTATVTTTDNEGQFTRYSRLRHYLRTRA
jgi:hypothetical protein